MTSKNINGCIIDKIKARSIASEYGLQKGDKLISVNGNSFSDIIDLSFLFADERLILEIEDVKGTKKTINIEKNIDDDLGIEFSSAVFDNVKECQNNCLFCFVNQMPKGMRKSLYVKDDDYRLSFLSGNFITLTNITQQEKERIINLNLSPLYVSVHATDAEVRTRLLKNPKASKIMEDIKELASKGIKFHTQVVLCPGFNDKNILEQTYNDLLNIKDSILSMAVVPVGLTKFRKTNDKIRTFTTEEAKIIVQTVESWQKECRKKLGRSFIYLSDEFYVKADIDFPEAEFYDSFLQYENGVGICRKFIDDWKNYELINVSNRKTKMIICGEAAKKTITQLVNPLKAKYDIKCEVLTVQNLFFGTSVTVTGLLTGQDILKALHYIKTKPDFIIIPAIAIRKEDNVFLDDITLKEFKKLSKYDVKVAETAKDLKYLISR